MALRLQKNTLLALYSVLEFTLDPTRHVSVADIARKYGVSAHHLAKVLTDLVRAGLVESVRGAGGGYRFSGNARRMTLMDVISLFERFEAPPTARRSPGERSPVGRALAAVLSEIDENAKATLGSITLATMHGLVARQSSSSAERPEPAHTGASAAPPRRKRSA